MTDDVQAPLVSARATARRSGLGRGLLMMAGTLAVVGVIGAALMPWSELGAARQAIARRMTSESPYRFLAPGEARFDLPAGQIFVDYVTDDEFEGTRYMASAELVFDLTVTAADGTTIEVEHETTQRANLPSSRPGRSATAVLVGRATIPAPGAYDVALRLGEGEAGQAIAEILVVDEAEIATLEKAFGPALAGGCGLGGALFFGIFGAIAVWLEKRAGI